MSQTTRFLVATLPNGSGSEGKAYLGKEDPSFIATSVTLSLRIRYELSTSSENEAVQLMSVGVRQPGGCQSAILQYKGAAQGLVLSQQDDCASGSTNDTPVSLPPNSEAQRVELTLEVGGKVTVTVNGAPEVVAPTASFFKPGNPYGHFGIPYAKPAHGAVTVYVDDVVFRAN